jgi:hypothetical protein
MKLKSKLVLAASSLLVLSGAAMGTGAYAWFTANQAATIATNFNVNANVGGLKIAVVDNNSTKLTPGTATDTSAAFTAGADATKKLTDISSDGNVFIKATLGSDNSVTGGVAKTAVLPYCFNFTATFTSTNSAKPMAVFLSGKSSFDVGGTKGATLSGAYRAAVLSSDGTSVLAYYAPFDATADLKYLGTAAPYSEKALPPTTNVLDSTYYSETGANDYTDITGTTTASAKGYVGTIAAGSSLVLKLRFWIEGTDAQAINANNGNVTSLNMIFNGVSTIIE